MLMSVIHLFFRLFLFLFRLSSEASQGQDAVVLATGYEEGI